MLNQKNFEKLCECLLDYLENNCDNLKCLRLRVDLYFRDKDDKKTLIKNRKHLITLNNDSEIISNSIEKKFNNLLNKDEIGY